MLTRTTAIIAVVFLLATAGCTCAPRREVPTAGPTSSPQPTPAPTVAASPPPLATAAAEPTDTASAPTETVPPQVGHLGEKKQGGNLGDVWTLADVRVGVHADQFRVVIEMREGRSYAPYYEAVQVDNAQAPFPTGHDPSWGAARIDIVISDLYLYDFPVDQLPIVAPTNPVVTRVGRLPVESDAHTGFSIGLTSPAPYEVYYFTEPVRIIIDVEYP